METIGYIFFGLAIVVGLIIIPLGLPGTVLILIAAAVYAWLTDLAIIGGWGLVVLTALTIISETADNWLTAIGVKRYGGSTRAMWLSVPGALLGAMLLGAPLALLLGPLGPIAGGFGGAFASVVLYEWSQAKNLQAALRAGWGTLLGRAAGILLKMVIAIGMVVGILLKIAF
jgi:uncharacterized protein